MVVGEVPAVENLITVLRRCRHKKNPALAQRILGHLRDRDLESHAAVGNFLVPMLVECGSLPDAQRIFDGLPCRNEHSWTSIISGYADCGDLQQAFSLYFRMQEDRVPPNSYTHVALLKACTDLKDLEHGRGLHADILRKGLDIDLFIGNTLVDMYGKHGLLAEAQQVFDKLPIRDGVSWNALISGYAEHGFGDEVLIYFEQMQLERWPPAPVTFACGVKACGTIGALEAGQEIHADLTRRGWESGLIIANALVDMYGRCGSLTEGREVFDKLIVKDVVSWTAMINGYGKNHMGNMAIQCFEDMQKQGVKPNAITFTCLLAACSHSNLVFEGQKYFKIMTERHDIEPVLEHYTCMVDLFARSGHVSEAERFVEASEDVLKSLLTACKVHGEVELGERCFQQLVSENQEDAAPYLLMVDIYKSAGRWNDATRLEEMRKDAGAKKKLANASIEVNRKLHGFLVGDSYSKHILTVLETLRSCLEDEGYVPNVDVLLEHVTDTEKESTSECVDKHFLFPHGLLVNHETLRECKGCATAL